MAEYYDNANVQDYDVVRSTQFVDDMSCGVREHPCDSHSKCTSLEHDCLFVCNANPGLAICLILDLETVRQVYGSTKYDMCLQPRVTN